MRLGIVALAVLALAGCGSEGSSEPVSAPPPSLAAPTSAAPSPSASEMAISGTVQEGVEPGCLLLATGAKSYLLIGGDKAALQSGAKVTVYGTPEPDLMTTCQQGTPFKVSRVQQ